MSNQTAEQIATWAERQDDVKGQTEPAKPRGAAGHLSAEQKQRIRVAYLESGGQLSCTQLGARCATVPGVERAVNRETVAACLKGPEFDALRKHFDTEIKAGAVERLKAGILPAADAWVKAVGVAADKGDHKPAKDLLMHTGTIEPLDDDGRARGPLVLIAVQQGHRSMSGSEPLWTDGTRTYTREEKRDINASFVQVGIDESDVTVSLSPQPELHAVNGTRPSPTRDEVGDVPMYRNPATGQLFTAAQALEASAKGTVVSIGVQLPGLPE